MTNHTTAAETNLKEWATATGASTDEVAAAWHDLVRRGLAAESTGQITLSPLALPRATSDTQRRLAAHLSGYLLTENSFIVRRAGSPPVLDFLNQRTAEELHNQLWWMPQK